MKVFEVYIDISSKQGWNEARNHVSIEHPERRVFLFKNLPDEYEVVGKFRYNISGLENPYWSHTFYVLVA
jgi:hypothetical protein